MSSRQQIIDPATAPETGEDTAFRAMSAQRVLIIGGIALIVVGMIFGDIFAIFVLHQNAGRIGAELLAATTAVAAGNSASVFAHFTNIGSFLENRGTKVDTHVHMIDFGYLALLLALVQPYVALGERRKKQLAAIFMMGAVMLPVCVFLIHYVGLAYSPLETIGWASIFADLGGLLVIIASAGSLVGLWRQARARNEKSAEAETAAVKLGSRTSRTLLTGGTMLILAGFLHGAYYAAVDLYDHEAKDVATLRSIIDNAAGDNLQAATRAVNDYGLLQANKAVKIAAHSHIIEFGLLAILLSFIQQYVFLSERWKRRWALVLLTGSVVLPVFVLLELQWGLVAGGIADVGGLLVIIGLIGMLAGVLRYTGRRDAEEGGAG